VADETAQRSHGARSTPDALREFNRRRVLAAVRAGRATNRGELCTVTGLSRSTVTGLVGELLADRTLVEFTSDRDPGRGAGRPARRLVIAPRDDLVIAIDLGHSHCRIGILDSAARIVVEDSSPMDVDSSADRALNHVCAAIDRLLAQLGPDRSRVVGGALGLPAPVNTITGTVGPGSVLPKWVDRHPADELEGHVGLPMAIDNDANLGALAEIAFGAARGLSDVIYVKVSTGIGAGLVLGGHVYRGSTGRAGEIGHVPVDPSGPVCRCGNRGCLETVASVTQVLAMMQPSHARRMTTASLTELVAAGDAGARRVVSDAGRTIGRVLADIVNNLNPEIVVLGGELSMVGDPLLDGVRESIDRFAQPGIARDLRVLAGELGERAQLLGAAALALDASKPAVGE
jgi:predicted NBD/HSP70 family sugar kinase